MNQHHTLEPRLSLEPKWTSRWPPDHPSGVRRQDGCQDGRQVTPLAFEAKMDSKMDAKMETKMDAKMDSKMDAKMETKMSAR